MPGDFFIGEGEGGLENLEKVLGKMQKPLQMEIWWSPP